MAVDDHPDRIARWEPCPVLNCVDGHVTRDSRYGPVLCSFCNGAGAKYVVTDEKAYSQDDLDNEVLRAYAAIRSEWYKRGKRNGRAAYRREVSDMASEFGPDAWAAFKDAEINNVYATCPYALQNGEEGNYGPNTCHGGCIDEPECHTCGPYTQQDEMEAVFESFVADLPADKMSPEDELRTVRRCLNCDHQASLHFLPPGNHSVRSYCIVNQCDCVQFVRPELIE